MLAKPSNPCMKYEVQAGLTKTKKEKKRAEIKYNKDKSQKKLKETN